MHSAKSLARQELPLSTEQAELAKVYPAHVAGVPLRPGLSPSYAARGILPAGLPERPVAAPGIHRILEHHCRDRDSHHLYVDGFMLQSGRFYAPERSVLCPIDQLWGIESNAAGHKIDLSGASNQLLRCIVVVCTVQTWSLDGANLGFRRMKH